MRTLNTGISRRFDQENDSVGLATHAVSRTSAISVARRLTPAFSGLRRPNSHATACQESAPPISELPPKSYEPLSFVLLLRAPRLQFGAARSCPAHLVFESIRGDRSQSLLRTVARPSPFGPTAARQCNWPAWPAQMLGGQAGSGPDLL